LKLHCGLSCATLGHKGNLQRNQKHTDKTARQEGVGSREPKEGRGRKGNPQAKKGKWDIHTDQIPDAEDPQHWLRLASLEGKREKRKGKGKETEDAKDSGPAVFFFFFLCK